MNTGSILKHIREKILDFCSVEQRVVYLRKQGVKIGQECNINTMAFSTEPYLIEIGNRVSIANGAKFITHDGAVRCFRDELEGGIYGKIKIGNNVFIGMDAIILFDTSIGDNCIVGAGSVVRGHFPENSVIIGNPAKKVLSMSIQQMLCRHNPGFVRMKYSNQDEKDRLVKKHFGIE